MSEPVQLNWQGPFALFRDEPYPYLFHQPCAQSAGVYLWVVPTPEGMKICYIGKAGGHGKQATLGSRLAQELKEALAGKYQQIVDIEAWRLGRRRVIHKMWSYDPGLHQQTLEQICRACLIYLAPIVAEETVIKRVEKTLILHMIEAYNDGPEFQPFLSNASKGNNRGNVAIRIQSHGSGLLGLADCICLDESGRALIATD
jgi:hypothetical protein